MENTSSPAEMRKLLAPVFTNYGVKRAILFGSFANGSANQKSDIDLLVDSGLRGLRFVSLCEDICKALGREVDLFDVTHIETDSKIDKEISATGVVIYER